jgi:hypothetical protein
MELFRHGDLLFKKIGEVPKGLEKIGHGRIEEGEVTGHHHQIQEQDGFNSYGVDGEITVLEVTGGELTLVHEDHHPIPLERGVYEVVRQRELNPYTQAAERVMD